MHAGMAPDLAMLSCENQASTPSVPEPCNAAAVLPSRPRCSFSMCNWGVSSPWEWGPAVGNSWRTDGDIAANWDAVLRALDNGAAGLGKYAGPGGWNDPDMLEVSLLGLSKRTVVRGCGGRQGETQVGCAATTDLLQKAGGTGLDSNSGVD